LEFLLTENHIRYLRDERDLTQPNHADAVKRNTSWFLEQFAPSFL
jgi:hypothetical protein